MASPSSLLRFFSDTNDSRPQKAVFRQGDPHCRDQYVAKFRLDTMLHDENVLVEAQIFDGSLFQELMRVSDSELERLPWEHVEIRGREDNLAQSWLRMVRAPAADKLTGYYFESLGTEEAALVHKELPKISADRVQSLRDMVDVLVDIGVDATKAELKYHTWSKVLDLVNRRGARFTRWDQQFDFNANMVEQLLKGKSTVLGLLTEGTGVEVIVHQIAGVGLRRSELMSLLDSMFEHTDDEFVKADIALVEAWYNTAYAKVQSIHHGCPSHEINHQRATVAMDESERDHDLYAAGLASRDLDKSLTRSLVKLSRKHVAVLATPSGEEFREFMASTKNMRRLQDWRSQRRADSLGEAIDDLASYVSDTIISGPVNRYLWPTFKLFSKVAGVGGGTYLGAIVADLAGAGPGVDAGQTAATGIAAATGAIFGDRFQGAVVGLVDNMFSPRKRFTRSIVKYARSSSV